MALRPDVAERNRLSRTHGMSDSSTFFIWNQMKDRCNNPDNHAFPNYGGRGISVCREWGESFSSFLADMGHRPTGMSIERIDNNGNYEPSNCRWATRIQQNNNRRNNRKVTAFGRTLTLAEWSRETGVNYSALRSRLDRGWPVETALSHRNI